MAIAMIEWRSISEHFVGAIVPQYCRKSRADRRHEHTTGKRMPESWSLPSAPRGLVPPRYMSGRIDTRRRTKPFFASQRGKSSARQKNSGQAPQG
jgi:hypothetical protein